jgi:hypothetical protein
MNTKPNTPASRNEEAVATKFKALETLLVKLFPEDSPGQPEVAFACEALRFSLAAPGAAPVEQAGAVALTSGAIYEIVKSTRLVSNGSAIEIANRLSAALAAPAAAIDAREQEVLIEKLVQDFKTAARSTPTAANGYNLKIWDNLKAGLRSLLASRSEAPAAGEATPVAAVAQSVAELARLVLMSPKWPGSWANGNISECCDCGCDCEKDHAPECSIHSDRARLARMHELATALAASPSCEQSVDARRYRWLREQAEPNRGGERPWCTVRDSKGHAWTMGSVLDAAIDAALAAIQPTEEKAK